MSLPNDARVLGFGKALCHIFEGCIPTPRIDARQPDSTFQQIQSRFSPHSDAYIDIVRESVARSRTGVDEDDIERLQRVVNALQLSLNVPGRHHVAVRKMTKVQFHASLEAPFKRYLIDSDCTLAAVH